MLLSDKFAYFHVPKTAGRSITSALALTLPASEAATLHRGRSIRYPGHITPSSFCDKWDDDDGEAGNALMGRFTFTFVRNPWDRARSLYYWIAFSRPLERWRPFRGNWQSMGFNEWVLRDGFQEFITTLTRPRPSDDYAMPWPLHQHSYVNYCGGELDYVGRYENLHNDFSFVCTQLGLRADLKHKNNNKKAVAVSYQEEYSDAARDKIADIFVKDIELFGYTFDGL